MKLSEVSASFKKIGVNVAAITYDPVAQNAKFQRQFKLKYPLLSDADAEHAIAFDILNLNYDQGHRAYGVPHPGIFLVNSKGKIVAKFAEKSVRDRPDFAIVLESAKKLLK